MHVFPAHIKIEETAEGRCEVIQPVSEHCRNSAEYARRAAAAAELPVSAYLAGLLHDCGKYTVKYEEYLRKAIYEGTAQKGSVNHTFVGVRWLLRRFHSTDGNIGFDDIACELLAYAVGAHHGLFDLTGPGQVRGFQHRLETSSQELLEEQALENYLDQCAGDMELEELFRKSSEELRSIFLKINAMEQRSEEHIAFYVGMLSRLLLSAVIEGDRRDTTEFMTGRSHGTFPQNSSAMWGNCLDFMEKKIKLLDEESAISRARAKISTRCRIHALEPGGVYRLNVPTGAGKTLSTLRYALAHSEKYGKQRIFFVMPLLSIIEQNSKVIKGHLPDTSMVLEHHSNAVHPKSGAEELDIRELLAENWEAPIIITTLVQFLDTLFSGRTTAIRRFHALCNSVIVLDEVQTVPAKMLSLFNLAINFLTEICGATVVLCSATQPCLEKTAHPLIRTPKQMIPFDLELWLPFQRTEIEDAGRLPMSEIPQFVAEKLKKCKSILLVCNKKDEAEILYRNIASITEAECFHLSAAMCMSHRRDTLRNMENALNAKKCKVVCVATQVIEAGVDISFECVIRFTAGMDSVIQAAGRCNRNGEASERAPVYLLRCSDERLNRLPDIQRAQNATQELLEKYRQEPGRFANDLASDRATEYYYRSLYMGMPERYQDYYLPEIKTSLLSMLSANEKYLSRDSSLFFMQQAFKTAGSAFKVFETDTTDIIVPYGKGADIIAELCSERAERDLQFAKTQLDYAKSYTVSLFSYQLQKLESQGAVHAVCGESILSLDPGFYSSKTGLILNELNNIDSEVTLCNTLIL